VLNTAGSWLLHLMQLLRPQVHVAASALYSFIHVTPVAEAHLSNTSPFQTPLITPNNKLIKRTNTLALALASYLCSWTPYVN
jgi:hypothetical protein